MLKLHSFLLGIKTEIKNLKNDCYKTTALMTVYGLIGIIIVLSSDNLYHGGSTIVEAYEKTEAETTIFTKLEENENQAQIRIDHSDYTAQLEEITTYGNIDIYGVETLGGTTLLELNSIDNASELVAKASINDTTISEQVIIAEEAVIAKEKARSEAIAKREAEEAAAIAKKKAKKAAKIAKAKKEAEEAAAKAKEEAAKKAAKAVALANSEKEILQRIVEAEASGEDLKGKVLVANVILNRVKSAEFPNTVEKVVFQRNNNAVQFSPTKDGRYWSVTVSKQTKTAVEMAMSGEDYSKGALYFSARSKADKSSMRWFDSSLKWLFAYGNHEFFASK